MMVDPKDPMGQSDKSNLLRQLRIAPSERDGASAGPRPKVLYIALGFVALTSLVSAWAYWKWHSRPFAVEIATALVPSTAQGPAAILQASGYVTARREATVSAQITGTVKEVLIEEGEHVKAGQVLARLDDAAYRAGVDQARAQLMAAQALEVQYTAQLAQARRETQRNQGLIDRNLVSRQSLETTQTQQDTLAAQLQVQRKQIELANAVLRGAQVQLAYCTVRAPFDGVIVAKAAQSGEIISPISAGGGFTRTGVGTIVDMDSLEIEVDVNESYINRVVAQQPAQALLDAYPDWNIPAHVIAIIPTADRNKATVKVRVALDQKDSRILPDMGVRVSFMEPGGTHDPAGKPPAPGVTGVLVPASALASGGSGGTVVYVLEGDVVRARAVKGGQAFGDLRVVTGLGAGVRVVRAPPAGMRDGARVSISAGTNGS
jgi:RND family efflux transporter MFP subunit